MKILAVCARILAIAISSGAFAKEIKNNTITGSKTPSVHINNDGLGQALVYSSQNGGKSTSAKKSSLINVNEGTDYKNRKKTGVSPGGNFNHKYMRDIR